MEEKPPTARHLRLWVFLGMLVFIPFLVVFVLKMVFAANAIRPDQLQPPKEIVSIKAAAPVIASSSKPAPEYLDFVAAGPNKTATDFLKKYMPEFKGKQRKIWKGWQSPGYIKATHFSADLVTRQWLIDHAGFVNDLIELANAGGLPTTSVEEAKALMVQGIKFFPRPMNSNLPLRSLARTLIAESRRRRDGGDMDGAAEALCAAYILAQSTSEPFISDLWESANMQTDAHRELAAWIGDGELQPDIARRIRANMMETSTSLEQYRRTIELQCLDARIQIIEYFQSPLIEIYGRKLSSLLNRKAIQDTNIAYAAGAYVGIVAQSAYTAVAVKSTASHEVKKLDEAIRATISAIENDGKTLPLSKQWLGFDEPDGRMRIKTNIAFMSVNVAALDMITSNSQTMVDPFTHGPLLRNDDTSGTLIYSVGPDMKDQHGTVFSGNMLEADDPYDIAVRIPRRGKK